MNAFYNVVSYNNAHVITKHVISPDGDDIVNPVTITSDKSTADALCKQYNCKLQQAVMATLH